MTVFPHRNIARFLAVVFCCSLVVVEAIAQQACRPSSSVGEGPDFFAGYVPTFESGDALPADGVFALVLKPGYHAIYPVDVEAAGGLSYGGDVTIESVRPGLYSIVISHNVRLDLVQGHPRFRLPAVACTPEGPGAYASVEVTAEGGPLTLQVTSARSPLIKIAVVRH